MKREERIKNARTILDGDCSDELREALVNAFPELTESEDERIRKKLYNTVLGTPSNSEWFDDFTKEQMLAYLEKQKEQQPAGGSSEKPNSQWRPSEEQMKALNEIINILAVSMNPHENDYLFNMINGLRKSLKKL